MTPNLARYERIAPLYDLLDLPFERRRYHALRPLLFQNLKGRLLDAGIGTGRNCAFYPPETIVSGIDTSPAMLARARRRCPTLSAGGRLYRMDVTALEFPAASFDAAVATFLFCVCPRACRSRRCGNLVAWSGRAALFGSSNMSDRAAPYGGSSRGCGIPGSPGLMAQVSIGRPSGTSWHRP